MPDRNNVFIAFGHFFVSPVVSVAVVAFFATLAVKTAGAIDAGEIKACFDVVGFSPHVFTLESTPVVINIFTVRSWVQVPGNRITFKSP